MNAPWPRRRDRSPRPTHRSPSGRVPQWAGDEAFGRPAAPADPWRSPAGPPSHSPKRPGRVRRRRRPRTPRPAGRFSPLVGVLVLAALFVSAPFLEREVVPRVSAALPWSDIPRAGVGAAAAPLGKPPVPPDSSSYSLYPAPPGQDVLAYDPCRPVAYVVRPDGAPAGADGLVEEAVAIVSGATGLRFEYRGPTAEAPDENRDLHQPDRYGDRWAPVLVAWSDAEETPDLAGDVAGIGGSPSVAAPGGTSVLVSGQAVLDRHQLATMLTWPGGRDEARSVIVHELAHVVGLGHVDDPAQLMYGGINETLGLAAGDRAGLARVGAGECVPEL